MATTSTPQLPLQVKGVLFDSDGTLVDSIKPVEDAWVRWCEIAGYPEESDNPRHGHPAAEKIIAIVGEQKAPELIALYQRLEMELAPNATPMPGGVESTAALQNASWCIVTSCDIDLLNARIKAAGIPTPPALCTIEDVTHGKPDPECFQVGAEKLGLDPGECVAIEDSPAGLASAKVAGCITIGLVTTTPRDQIHADIVVDDLSKLRFSVDDGTITIDAAS